MKLILVLKRALLLGKQQVMEKQKLSKNYKLNYKLSFKMATGCHKLEAVLLYNAGQS